MTESEEFVYDPDDPKYIEDRANDPDDGIDYDEIYRSTEADVRAGRVIRFGSFDEFERWGWEVYRQVGVELRQGDWLPHAS